MGVADSNKVHVSPWPGLHSETGAENGEERFTLPALCGVSGQEVLLKVFHDVQNTQPSISSLSQVFSSTGELTHRQLFTPLQYLKVLWETLPEAGRAFVR